MGLIDTISIHRGRNRTSIEICKSLTNLDYNFDYRGIYGGSVFSPLWLFFKAWLTSKEIPEAKNYFIEGGLCFIVGFFLKKRYPNSKLFVMIPEPVFLLEQNKSWISKKTFLLRMSMMKNTVDHYFFISDMVKDGAIKLLGSNIQYSKLRFYIPNIEQYKKVEKIERNILFVCARPHDTGYIKGLDIAVKIFEKFNQKYRETKLYIVGASTEQLSYKNKNILCLGYCDFDEIYRKTSVLLVPARYEAFSMVVPESALSGLVPIVSTNVGVQEFLQKIDKKLIIDKDDTDQWVDTIERYLNLNDDEQKVLYDKFYNAFSLLNKRDVIHNLSKEFNEIKYKTPTI